MADAPWSALDAYWRAANYLSVGQIYLLDENPLLREPLRREHVKRRLLGHWGTTPTLNFVYTHLNRAVAERALDAFMIVGPGHGGPAATANAWLDGTLGEVYPDMSRDAGGMGRLFEQFSFPYGLPSHVGPEVPGSMHEGGELGYSLAHAVGAVLDNPGLVVGCVIGDGEAETAALSASWQSTMFLNPAVDGAVLPILHLNGYKIANPTVFGRMTDEQIDGVLRGYGWDPIHVAVGGESTGADRAHRMFADALDAALDRIEGIQRASRHASPAGTTTDGVRQGDARPEAGWPVIVLRSPKGWTGPAEVDGEPVEGTWRSHQVPLDDVRDRDEHLRALEDWMRSYRPDELFDADGRPARTVVDWLPAGDRRLSANPHTTGGRRQLDLDLPDPFSHSVEVPHAAASVTSPTETLGGYLTELIERDAESRCFRLFGPDETESNRLDAVFDATSTAWQGELLGTDEHLGREGRVMEVLSEHLCQGWLEGYLLTGRHGLFSCYEAFAPIVASMFNQHAKWLKVSRELPWRSPVPSLNYLLTSHVWRQDHNGFSHQDPGFVDHVAGKPTPVTRVYFPPDANSLVHVIDRCLRSRDLVNVVVAGKHPTPDWLDARDAAEHVERGFGTWAWASDGHADPDVVLACAGDVPTVETMAAVQLLREHLPEVAVRVVNVVDLMRLQSPDDHPHGASDENFDDVFGRDTPVLFAYHGYPALIHRLTHDRAAHDHLHVRGYRELGSTTTPFDMVVRNRVDRFQLVMDAIDLVSGERFSGEGTLVGWSARADEVSREMEARRSAHRDHVASHGDDLPEIRHWSWDLVPAGDGVR
jgi:xylulose-5-phosphate/fructose-6-phosphate phosphoketolase